MGYVSPWRRRHFSTASPSPSPEWPLEDCAATRKVVAGLYHSPPLLPRTLSFGGRLRPWRWRRALIVRGQGWDRSDRPPQPPDLPLRALGMSKHAAAPGRCPAWVDWQMVRADSRRWRVRTAAMMPVAGVQRHSAIVGIVAYTTARVARRDYGHSRPAAGVRFSTVAAASLAGTWRLLSRWRLWHDRWAGS